MRRLFVLLCSLLAATTLLAGTQQKTPGEEVPRVETQGRAVVVHLDEALTTAEQDVLEASGLKLLQPLSGGRFLARVAPGAAVDASRLTIEPLTAAHKIHRSARAELGRGRTAVPLQIIFHKDVPFEEARTAITAAGGAISDPLKVRYSPSRRIDALVAPATVDALAADERVLAIAGAPRWKVRSDNATSAALIKAADVQAPPYNLSGEGVTVSVFELAIAQASHPEFQGRLLTIGTGGSSGDKQHATHVSGTIGAAGLNAQAKGMAPKVTIQQFCVFTPCDDGGFSFLDDKEEKLVPLGVVVDSNSWGFVLGWSSEGGYPVWNDAEEYFGAYDLTVGAPVDEISNEKGILFVHSAGNDGDAQSFSNEFSEHRHVDGDGNTINDKVFCYAVSGVACPTACTGGCETVRHDPDNPFDTIGVMASAKNVITVGSVATVAGGPLVSGFSSRGPAKDGRVKPDVVARGSSVLSTIPTNDYGRLSGTSMSTPAVTGVAALLVEQWRKSFSGASPTPAQLKALIIAGADDLGNPGPDYTYGFGLVNAKKSVDMILADAGTGSRIRNVTFAQGKGQQIESTLSVPQTQDVRVVLYWPDPPIAMLGNDDIAEKALVNNLDLRIVGPAGTEYRPWILDKARFRDNATTGTNSVDNIEVIDIAGAAPGVYRVIATGTNVAEGPQRAVVITSVGGVVVQPCRDPQEVNGSNDTAQSAYGNLVPGQSVSGALCTQGDVDFYKFNVTKAGPVTVSITARDTAVRAVLTGAGVNGTVDVPANSTRTIVAATTSLPLPLLLQVTAAGTIGTDPGYTIIPVFGQTSLPRRRSVH